MLTWQELWSYVRLLLRWSPLIVVAMALSGGTAWYISRSQPDFYQARASLMVGNNFEASSPNTFAVDLSNSLARFYEVLLHREVILGPVAEQLGLGFSWELINTMLAVTINPQANLLEITITDSNPERAAALANAIGERLIAYSPNAPEKVAAQQAEVDRQITEAQASLAQTDHKLEILRERQQRLNAAIDLRENQDQIDQLEKAREKAQDTYNQLLLLRNNSQANTLSFFERATPPSAPLPQKTLLVVGGAGLGGLILAVAAVLLLDRIDTRWRSGDELQQWSGIAHLGSVIYGARRAGEALTPRSAQAVRETHTQIALAASDRAPRLLLLSSPQPSESRSAYAIDLAYLYGQAGHRVLLVDADLAWPQVGKILRMRGEAPRAPQQGAIERWVDGGMPSYKMPAELWRRLRTTAMANVMVLPSDGGDEGGMPILVPSVHWPELVEALRNIADVVIFDGPSALTGADATLLAPLVDGVVLVLSPDADSRSAVAKTKQWLTRSSGARLLGAVTVTGQLPGPRRAPRQLGFGVSFDAGGMTITLPARKRLAPQLEAARGAEPFAREGAPRPAAPHVTPTYHSADRDVIITPPPAVIITPPPDEGRATTPRVRPAGRRRPRRG